MGRTCQRCGYTLSRYHIGKHCYTCLKIISDELDSNELYYDIEDMSVILGISGEQVKRKGRAGSIPGKLPEIKAHRYSKTVVDEWIASAGQGYHKPANPVQEEAYQQCQNGDHSWFEESKFDGLAYRSETVSELEGDLLKVIWKRTCYFCGHVELGWL